MTLFSSLSSLRRMTFGHADRDYYVTNGKYLLANGLRITIIYKYSYRFNMPDTDVVILKALLEANTSFVSGSALAEKLGISRVGIWARLEKLRKIGFEFEAVRHRGYRLISEPSLVNEDLLNAYLQLDGTKTLLCFRNDIDSTSSEAERLLAHGEKTPLVVVAQRQTSGRGRLGRQWHSSDQGNLYMSFGFRPQMAPAQMQMITLWMGVQICRYINERLGLPAQVKWPNDIVSGSRKLCGILAEARVDADRTRDLVFGIGVNVNSDCGKWPTDMATVATSLASLGGKPLRINLVAAELIEIVSRAYDRYIAGQYAPEIFELWSRFDSLRGRVVRGWRGQEEVVGTASGIDEHGNLLLIIKGGETRRIQSGEISFGTRVLQ
jgi:BirA family transcriptional regulator, biotin operon repressor / biotin---[acetyl-CoA-carboxylase] ligase